MQQINLLILLITSASCNGFAQLLRKHGSNGSATMGKLLTNPYFIGGGVLYGISIFVWLYCLKYMPVSSAYPFISFAYIITALGGVYFFHESLGLLKIIGLCCILIGIFFIAKSS